MGGGSYDRDVYESSGSSSSSGFHYSYAAEENLKASSLDASMLPFDRDLTLTTQDGVVIILDVTGSMGDSTKVVYDKFPMLWGQIEQQGYLKDFSIAVGAVGDTHGDESPLQIGDFAQGKKLDKWIEKIHIEGNGQGGGHESYETMGYFLANHVTKKKEGNKLFLFFVGDEAPYDSVSAADIKSHFGDKVSKGATTEEIVKELNAKFEFFFLHVAYSSGNEPEMDKKIVAKWRKLLGERFIILKEPKSVVDVILGIIAMVTGARSLDEYDEDLKERGQSETRRKNVAASLAPLKESTMAVVRVKGDLPATTKGESPHRSKRL